MLFAGRIWKDGNWWLAEVPLLDLMTQGKTRTEAGAMLKDAIEELVNEKGFSVRIVDHGNDNVGVDTDRFSTLFALALRRLREAHGLSIAAVTKSLGPKSKNAYARYENGESSPTLDKAMELLRAVAPDEPVVLNMPRTMTPRPRARRSVIGRSTS